MRSDGHSALLVRRSPETTRSEQGRRSPPLPAVRSGRPNKHCPRARNLAIKTCRSREEAPAAMTYCCGILVRDGLVMFADTRTNAGVDNIATFRKLHVFTQP